MEEMVMIPYRELLGMLKVMVEMGTMFFLVTFLLEIEIDFLAVGEMIRLMVAVEMILSRAMQAMIPSKADNLLL
jgi:hypothetical protein